MDAEAVVSANPRVLDAEAEYIAIEVPRIFRERLHAVLNLDDRHYPDKQGYLDSVPTMLETCFQDARLNFGFLNTLSGHDLGSTTCSRILSQLEPHVPNAANHARRTFMPDHSPSQPTPESHLHRRHSMYTEHGIFRSDNGPFAVTEQASASDSGYMGMTGQWQHLWHPEHVFQDFDMGNFDNGAGTGASHFQIGDPVSGNSLNFDFACGEGQEGGHQHQE